MAAWYVVIDGRKAVGTKAESLVLVGAIAGRIGHEGRPVASQRVLV